MESESLTLKSLQSHLIKWTVTSALSTFGLALLLLVGFYYKTNNRMDLTEINITTITEVQKAQTNDINIIKEKMSADNASAIALDKRLSVFEARQQEIYNVLLDMARKQSSHN